MKRLMITAIALTGFAGFAVASEVAPGDVSFEEGAASASVSGTAGDAQSGREIVGDKKLGNCIACHEVSDLADVPFQGNVGPVLDGVGDRWNEAQLRGIVVNAKEMFPDTVMPAFYKTDGFTRPGNAYTGEAADDTFGPILSAQQIEDVVAYLATLKE